MAEDVVRFGKDTWAGSGAPSVNHNDANRIKLKGADIYGYLHLKNPVPHGLTVVTATLTVYVSAAADWSGTKTVSVKRLSERARFGKLTWDNKPGTTGAQKDATVTSPTSAQAINIDVTSHVQQWADGDPNYGWRVSTDSTTAIKVWGFDSDYPPILTVEYAISPSQPVDLSPSGGAVSVAKPVFDFDAVDLTNPQDMTDLQIQIDPAANATAPAFDSGWVAATAPQWDSSASAWAGLADGASTQWRARYRNGSVEGDWSDWVTFSRAVKGAVTITNPAASPNNFVAEATPPLAHTFSGTQVAWRKFVTKQADQTERVTDSGKTDGTALSWTPPKKKLHDDGDYTLTVRVFDNVVRVATPGDPIYAEATRDFTFQHDATVNAPVMVGAAQQGVTPFVDVTFTRATMPDSWTILRDGKVIDALVDPVDIFTTGTTYVYTDPGASPQVAHTYEVRAVVNGKASPKSAAATVTTTPAGVWLLDQERGLYVLIAETGVDNWRRTDRVAVYELANGGFVQVYAGDNGISGSFAGALMDKAGRTTAQWRVDFDAMAARKNRVVQLIAADLSIPVIVRNMSATPHPETKPSHKMDLASFDFFEVVE